jgi:hypothetical protein
LVAVGLLATVGCGDGGFNYSKSDEPIETYSDSFDVEPSIRLFVVTFNGSITVKASVDDRVTVNATVRRADKVEYRVEQEGNTITVIVAEHARTTGKSPGADIVVTVPADTTVKLTTNNGPIVVRGVEQSGNVGTSNGLIELIGVKGTFVAETSNGHITVNDAVGSVMLETTNGAINFAGEMTAGGRNIMKTSNGSIDIALQGTPSVEVDATTNNATIRSDIPINTSSTKSTKLEGTIGSGEANLTAETSNGSIVIR